MPKRQTTAQKKARALAKRHDDMRYIDALICYRPCTTRSAPSSVSLTLPIAFPRFEAQMAKIMAPFVGAHGQAVAAVLAPALKVRQDLVAAATKPALETYWKLVAPQMAAPATRQLIFGADQLRINLVPRSFWISR
ncbi:hypothetical protein [Streptomyces triculaminicus]|uniref:hypothetical protein n=1 Tax=Streptomyces triculaminicus TaxID=2816232 RepID=UPI0037CD0BD2